MVGVSPVAVFGVFGPTICQFWVMVPVPPEDVTVNVTSDDPVMTALLTGAVI